MKHSYKLRVSARLQTIRTSLGIQSDILVYKIESFLWLLYAWEKKKTILDQTSQKWHIEMIPLEGTKEISEINGHLLDVDNHTMQTRKILKGWCYGFKPKEGPVINKNIRLCVSKLTNSYF